MCILLAYCSSFSSLDISNWLSQTTYSRPSFWAYASKLCGLASVQKNPSKVLRIDKYWSKVGKIWNESGNLKYCQFFQLANYHCHMGNVHLNVVFPSTKHYLTLERLNVMSVHLSAFEDFVNKFIRCRS